MKKCLILMLMSTLISSCVDDKSDRCKELLINRLKDEQKGHTKVAYNLCDLDPFLENCACRGKR